MRSAEDIAKLYYERKMARDPLLSMAQQIRDAYYGEIAIPMPELDRNEQRSVANLLQQGLDQTAQRIRSVMPTLWCPPLRPGSKRSETAAADRRRAMLGWWKQNSMKTRVMGYRARHLLGYATSPVYVRPDFKRKCPQWQVRDPLTCFPAPGNSLGDMTPTDAIFCVTRTRAWLDLNYPDTARRLRHAGEPRPGDKFDVLEYVDVDELVLIVLGKTSEADVFTNDGARYIELERVANLAGTCPVVAPGRIGLDRTLGRYDGMLGLFFNQAKLAALEMIAIREGVIPYQWFVVRPNETFVVETEADPKTGQYGVVRGADLHTVTVNPGYKTDQAIDRLERYQRLEGRIPAEYGGESASNVRTDRRGNTIMSATIDYEIAEAHDLLAESLEHENRIGVAVDKAYFGDESKPFYVSMYGRPAGDTYTPSRLWETDENVVAYPMPGTDQNSLIIGLAQRLGTGLMSDDTAMELDPLVDDPEQEKERIVAVALRKSLLASIEQQATAGAIPPADLARIAELVQLNHKTLYEAVTQAHREAQERQAPAVNPVAPGMPEAQPGLAAPGQGAEAGTIGPPPGAEGLSQLLGALHRPAEMMQGAAA